MKRNFNKFDFLQMEREEIGGSRHYVTPCGNLPSVTTILSATEPEEKRQSLQNWRDRVGEAEAARITKEASDVGTLMHAYLENWVLDQPYEPGNNFIHKQARKMADTIKTNSTPHLDEVWGTEVELYFPDLYAGTTDLLGVWNGKPAIMDFKQTNKPKKREWIDSYFKQGAAYAMCMEELYGVEINNIVILMCSRDFKFQLFEVDTKSEMDMWKTKWARSVEQYFNDK